MKKVQRVDARKLGWGLMAVGILGVLLMFLFPTIGINILGGPAAAADNCASTGITAAKPFYADQARADSHQFGPDQNYHDKKTALRTLSTAMSCDYYVAATEVDFKQSGDEISVGQVNATAKTYGGDKKAWSNAVQGFLDSIDVSKSYTKYEHAKYSTLGMIPNGSGQPTLFAATPGHEAGWTLVLTFKDGTVRKLRIPCLFQPEEVNFPNVPSEANAKPAPQCTSTKTHPCGGSPGCTKPPCGGSTPGCTAKPCGTPTPKCCTTTAEAQIPTQEKGQPTVAVPGAPKQRPKQNPTGPQPQPNSPPPAHNSGGYDSGGGSGSAPGGSQCGSSSCTGGGNPKPTGPASTPQPITSDPSHNGDPGLGGGK